MSLPRGKKEETQLYAAALCRGSQKSSFACFGQIIRALKASCTSSLTMLHLDSIPWAKQQQSCLPKGLHHHGRAGWSELFAPMWFGDECNPEQDQHEAVSPGPAPALAAHTWGRVDLANAEKSPPSNFRREEFNFSFFQSFFRDHKYLWRACQSFLGFLTECHKRRAFMRIYSKLQ